MQALQIDSSRAWERGQQLWISLGSFCSSNHLVTLWVWSICMIYLLLLSLGVASSVHTGVGGLQDFTEPLQQAKS
jgi:hypothetical protein